MQQSTSRTALADDAGGIFHWELCSKPWKDIPTGSWVEGKFIDQFIGILCAIGPRLTTRRDFGRIHGYVPTALEWVADASPKAGAWEVSFNKERPEMSGKAMPHNAVQAKWHGKFFLPGNDLRFLPNVSSNWLGPEQGGGGCSVPLGLAWPQSSTCKMTVDSGICHPRPEWQGQDESKLPGSFGSINNPCLEALNNQANPSNVYCQCPIPAGDCDDDVQRWIVSRLLETDQFETKPAVQFPDISASTIVESTVERPGPSRSQGDGPVKPVSMELES
ncbi:hypothetical protein GX51_01255 [Blastomyces parvus]|uniref:Uncharacterized protein n=1 Tax=Blastomyces parvus TaxID=2060905 RepID=A0A2B7XII5_9EURO|nr:hypothetical protein GX51_01255 [Blastomyces parvus]